MSKLNMQISLNSYADKVETNQNFLNHFKWLRSASGVLVDNPQSSEIVVAQNSATPLFNGTVSLSQDSTTEYDISLQGASTYKIAHTGGTAPNFRTERVIGLDNTSVVTITKNSSLVTATFSAGTLPNLSSVVIGDEVRIINRGVYKVLSKTSTSIAWENETQIDEVITLSSPEDFRIYSSSGVQKNQNISIKSGFSPVTYGDYNIIDVAPDYILITSPKVLPVESGVLAQLTVYKSSKKIIYIESNQPVKVVINGTETTQISPLIDTSSCLASSPAILLLTGAIHSAEIVNEGVVESLIYYISAE